MEVVLLIAVLIFSVVVHEVAHAWQARREGDDTADRLGRITLNPLPHLDPIGSVIVPLVLHLPGSGFLFGWAKPVPVNPANYRSPVWGDIRVSMAGIVSNLGLAVLSTFGLAIAFKAQSSLGSLGGATALAAQAAYYGVLINLVLAFFNLIPIPPLDGSWVLEHLFPRTLGPFYSRIRPYGFILFVLLIYSNTNILGYLLLPAIMTLLPGFALLSWCTTFG